MIHQLVAPSRERGLKFSRNTGYILQPVFVAPSRERGLKFKIDGGAE